MIIVTGGAGFIGSCLITALNEAGQKDIVLVDDFTKPAKSPNYKDKSFKESLHRDLFLNWFKRHGKQVDIVYHLGARTDTTEFNKEIFDYLNIHFSKEIWRICTEYQIPLIYASSAATYGLGENGFSDDHQAVSYLEPLNPYGQSKQDFDQWVLEQDTAPPVWFGLKFFNVYGPNEYHKGRMASVIMHTYNQIKKTGQMKLFRSHREDIADGEQSRDFIYVKDVLDMMMFLSKQSDAKSSGLYNIGTGQARTFYDLAAATFRAMNLEPDIHFIDTPADIRDTYQYYTQADMTKLQSLGYNHPIYDLEKGVNDYVSHYLKDHNYF